MLFQWAFGVTLWELMSLAQQPYSEVDSFEMAAYLREGYRIAQPINCPDELLVANQIAYLLLMLRNYFNWQIEEQNILSEHN